MIYELRQYRLYPGKTKAFTDFFAEKMQHVVTEYGELLGSWTTVTGALNTAVFLWRYESLDARTRQRAALTGDPRFQAVVQEAAAFMQGQESTFLDPMAFSALK
jgi:quinol monooxygenase YgiN